MDTISSLLAICEGNPILVTRGLRRLHYITIPGDRWIPRTNGQLRGKCFHLMTSSCIIVRSQRTRCIKIYIKCERSSSKWICNYSNSVLFNELEHISWNLKYIPQGNNLTNLVLYKYLLHFIQSINNLSHNTNHLIIIIAWHHDMETASALLAFCQRWIHKRQVIRKYYVFFVI